MNAKRTGLIITFMIALLLTGCGIDTKDQEKQLKPPSVHRNPQVEITHAPTELVVDVPTNVSAIEATASATEAIVYNNAEDTELPTDEEEQFLMDQIEGLLNKIEGELDRMDTNP